MGVFAGWIGMLGVTCFSTLVCSIAACFNKVLVSIKCCEIPLPRREFVWGVGHQTLYGLLERLSLEISQGKDCPFGQGREFGCLLFPSRGTSAPLILVPCGFSGKLNKILVCGQCWGCQKSLAISCDSSLGNFWAVAKTADVLPWVMWSQGHWWQDMQRCCRAWLGLCVHFCRLLG